MNHFKEALSMEALEAEVRFDGKGFADMAGRNVVSRVRRRRTARAVGTGATSALAVGGLAAGMAHLPSLREIGVAGDPCAPSAVATVTLEPTSEGSIIRGSGDSFVVLLDVASEDGSVDVSVTQTEGSNFDWPVDIASVALHSDPVGATVTFADGSVVEVPAAEDGSITVTTATSTLRIRVSGRLEGGGTTFTLTDPENDQQDISTTTLGLGSSEVTIASVTSDATESDPAAPEPSASGVLAEVTVEPVDEPGAATIATASAAAGPTVSPSVDCGDAASTDPSPSPSLAAPSELATLELADSPFQCGARLDEIEPGGAELALEELPSPVGDAPGLFSLHLPHVLADPTDPADAATAFAAGGVEVGGVDPATTGPRAELTDVMGVSMVTVVDGVVVGLAAPETRDALAASLDPLLWGDEATVDLSEGAFIGCEGLGSEQTEWELYLVAGEAVVGPEGLVSGPSYAWTKLPTLG